MNFRTLILHSLRFHARSHLGALLGAAVGSAVLIGALVVGDSVRASLRALALARLGNVDFALASNDRLFRVQLAADLQRSLPAGIAPALALPGLMTRADGSARANHVQVFGVDDRFWKLSRQQPGFGKTPDDGVVLNAQLAGQLNAKPGDTVVLRLQKPSQLSRDAPVSPQENFSIALRLTVHAVVADDEFGRFSLQANQVAPYNAFVPLARLGMQLDQAGRANLLLAGKSGLQRLDADRARETGHALTPALSHPMEEGGRRPGEGWVFGNTNGAGVTLVQVNAALRQDWQLADAELELRELPGLSTIELRTSRVFLDPPTADAAVKAAPGAAGILTYFVNELRVDDRTTPYSMVAALGPPVVPREMRDDEILVNQWLADDLQVKPGDALTVAYYVVGAMRKLEERSTRFRVRAVVPMTGPAADRTLMPEFPGMAKAQNCRDWDTGFPIQLDRMRAKDQKYWEDYRGTPKAFVTLAAGQRLWSNRFGNLTAVRYPSPATSFATVQDSLRRSLDPASVGLMFQPVRAQALAASDQAQDFGQLFLGFSFFLIVAALLLMALLFQFGIEQRASEIGTLLALGFRPRTVRRLLLGEGGALALMGAILGTLGGVAYARAMLLGLATIWRSAVGVSALKFHAESLTLIAGGVAGVGVSVFTVWLALRKQARKPARELLAQGAEAEPLSAAHGRRRHFSPWLALVAAAGALALLGWAGASRGKSTAGACFGAGALLLIAGLSGCAALLLVLGRTRVVARLNLGSLGLRNCTRRSRRSLATVALLACGVFLIVGVGANRQDPARDSEKRSSGTGGFALIGESTLPIVQDLNSETGRQFFGFDAKSLPGVQWVALRVHDGDDASCLNLNRAQTPRLLGVRPEQLASRGAFTFAAIAKGSSKENPWRLLDQKTEDGSVPAIGDEASIQWALGKSIGDTMDYTDERGRKFKLRLVGAVANSILQGSLLIAEDQFVARFPSESGYRMFLVDAPSNEVSKISATLVRGLQDLGLELTPTPRRLAEFDAVENTYLSTFQVLGGLGLLLGSVGLGVVVLRNVLERRGELALLLAVGFEPRALRWLVLSEHGALLLSGLLVGVVAALVAVMPALLSPGAQMPYLSLSLTLGAVLLSGAVWTWLATMLALRGKLLDALRNN